MLFSNIKKFIDARIQEHPQIHPWLADWSYEHETQINIDPTGLEEAWKDGKQIGWIMPSDGYEYTVNHIRIPYGAMTDYPTFHDRQVIGPIHHRWMHIGTTGWNWVNKKSEWVGFDFDSLTNHNEGLTPEQLQEVLNRAKELPYVVARTSKSGKGIHLLVSLKQTTRNHTEHAQLAQYVLSRMSKDCGFDFHASADVCGGILWHWERDLNDNGLKRID